LASSLISSELIRDEGSGAKKMGNKEHLTLEGFREIARRFPAIKCSLNKGLSEKLKQKFPDIVPVPRPKVQPPA